MDRKVSITALLVDRFTAPGQRMKKVFSDIQKRVTGLGSALGPLNSNLVQLGLGVVGLQKLNESISLAETQIDSEIKLLSALQGREDTLQRILDVTTQIQSETRTGDETLNQTAATLINMGLGANLVEKGLRASVDTSAALGVEVGLIERGIGRIAAGGTAGLLGSRLPFISQILEDGGDVEDVLDALLDKFEGTAAQLASSDFGKAEQIANLIGDAYEKIGIKLVGIRNIFRQSLLDVLERFNKLLDSDEFSAFSRIVRELGPLLTKAAVGGAGLIAVLAAIKAGAFLVGVAGAAGALLLALIAIAPEVTVLTLGLKGILSLIPSLSGGAASTANELGRAKDNVVALFKEFATGKISLEGLLDGIKTEVLNLGIRITSDVFVPLDNNFQALTGNIETGFALTILKISKLFFNMVEEVGTKFEDLINKAIFNISKTFVDNLPGAVPGALDGVLGQLTADLKIDFDVTSPAEEAALDALIKKTSEDFSRGFEEANQKSATASTAASAIIAANSVALAARLEQDRNKIEQNLETSIAKEVDLFRSRRTSLFNEAESLANSIDGISSVGGAAVDPSEILNLDPADLREFLSTTTSDIQGSISELLNKDLTSRLDAEEIGLKEFFEVRRVLEVSLNEDRLSALDSELSILREQEAELVGLRDISASTKEELSAQLELEGDIRDTRRELLGIEKERAGILISLAGSELDLRQEIKSAIQATGSEADSLKSKLEEQLSLIEKAREVGDVTETQSLSATREAFNDFNSEIDQILVGLNQLKQDFPELAPVINDTVNSINSTKDSVEDLDTQSDGFFQGILDGFEGSTEVIKTWGETGQDVAGSLINELDEGIAIALGQSEQSFKDWAKNLLIEIVKVIAKAAIMKKLFSETGEDLEGLGEGGGLGGILESVGLGGFFGSGLTQDSASNFSGSGDLFQPVGESNPTINSDKITTDLSSTLETILEDVFGGIGGFLSGLFGGGGGGGGGTDLSGLISTGISIFGGSFGFGFSEGGGVHRPGGKTPGNSMIDRDTVTVRAQPGEWYIKKPTTRMYGDRIMAAINSGSIPKSILAPYAGKHSTTVGRHTFEGGGSVSSSRPRSSGGGGAVPATIVGNNGDLDRLLKGGKGGFMKFVRQFKSEINANLKE